MAEVNNCPDPALPTKRISDLTSQDASIELKKQKLDKNNGKEEIPLTKNDVVINKEHQQQHVEEKEEKEEEVEEEQEEEEEDDDDGDEHSNGEPVIDRKGKGILIEEDEDEDDDDDDDDDSDSDDSAIGGDELSDDSDFVDDPLAEVNLDNILPSRTRRKSINPGTYLATDHPDEDSDDESDDPDA